ncbi:hypothetical protein EON65_50740 [archaeon]|nr:MAG: hypothetical protein EON65_50740 [archaeon]
MAKQLVYTLLVKVLGEFVELDENNLSLAVWSGQIKLHNLKLKTENILKGHQFHIHHGIVQTLEVTIPWRSIWASPLKIKLSGVLLDLGPIDINDLQKANILKGMLERKLQKLALVDKYLELSQSVSNKTESSGKASETYLQSWTSLILDNIEVSLEKVHLRYEDCHSIPGTIFAAGITLESFTLSTCDDNWQPAFIKKSNKPDAYVNKLATLNNFGFYWEPNSDMLAQLNTIRWQAVMLEMIQTAPVQTQSPSNSSLHYIISPAASSMTLKLTHRPRPADNHVQYDISLHSKDMNIQLDSVQYTQLFQLYYRIDALRHVHDPLNYRPVDRPTASREAARQWWMYAKVLAIIQPRYVENG